MVHTAGDGYGLFFETFFATIAASVSAIFESPMALSAIGIMLVLGVLSRLVLTRRRRR